MSTQKNVLVVDDEEDIARVFRLVLERRGYQVTICHTVAEAIEAIREQTFEVIFTDWRFPGGTALQLVLAARQFNPEAKVYIVTGTPDDPGIAEAGADKVIPKPVTLETIVGLAAGTG